MTSTIAPPIAAMAIVVLGLVLIDPRLFPIGLAALIAVTIWVAYRVDHVTGR